MPRLVDLLVHGEGSIYLLRPTSRRGQLDLDDGSRLLVPGRGRDGADQEFEAARGSREGSEFTSSRRHRDSLLAATPHRGRCVSRAALRRDG